VSTIVDRFGFGDIDEATVSSIRAKINDEVLPRHLQNFETILSKSSSVWLAGGPNPSIADFILSVRLKWLVSGANTGISSDLLSGYPRICKMIDNFENLPQIKKYYKK